MAEPRSKNRKYKSTNAEVARRVTEVYGLLSQAYSRTQVLQYAAEKWEVSERTADEYIKRARESLEKDCELSRAQFLAELMQRLRTYETKAAQRGQMQVAVNSARLQAELVSLTD